MQRTRRAPTESELVEARLIVRSLKMKEQKDKNRGNADENGKGEDDNVNASSKNELKIRLWKLGLKVTSDKAN